MKWTRHIDGSYRTTGFLIERHEQFGWVLLSCLPGLCDESFYAREDGYTTLADCKAKAVELLGSL